MKNRYEIDMCTGPLAGKILLYALPLMLSSVLQLLFNAADIVVVGRFAADGNTALAAVGSTGSLINLVTNLFIGLSTGATVLVSRHFGAKDALSMERAVHTAITVAGIGGLLVGLFGFFCAEPLLILMKTPETVLPGATLYVKIYFCGMPAVMLYNFGASILRAVGDTRRPLWYLILAGVINVVLNLFFVIILHLDVAGVALATVLSQCISCILVLRCLIVNGGSVQLIPKKLRIYKRELLQIARVGVPAGVQSTLFSLSNVVIQSGINSFGDVVMAGNAAANNIDGFIYVSMNAFYQASISFVSQNVGAGKLDRVRRVIFMCFGMVVAVGIAVGGTASLCGEFLLGIYRPGETEVIAAGMDRMRIVARTYFLCGVMEVLTGALRGLGRSVMPMIVSLLGACGLRILWMYTVFAWFPTIDALYLSYPVTWLITSSVHAVCLIYTYKKRARYLPVA